MPIDTGPAGYPWPDVVSGGYAVSSQAPRLVSAFRDSQGRVSLAFRWPPAVYTGGVTLGHYEVTLWADEARDTTIPGGATLNVTTPTASFTGIGAGASFLLDVIAVGSDNSRSNPISLIGTSTTDGTAPALPVGSPSPPVESDITGVIFGIRPIYGSLEGAKRWARIVTFGPNAGQVSNLDLMYFLMGASDMIDSYLEGAYYVPLLKYTTPDSPVEKYPPNIAFQCDRLAAALLIQARKAILTEDESSYASSMEAKSIAEIERLSRSMSLPGQSLGYGFTPTVYNSNPRQFAMPGDAAGFDWNPATGIPDMRSWRVSELPYYQTGWRYGGGFFGGDENG